MRPIILSFVVLCISAASSFAQPSQPAPSAAVPSAKSVLNEAYLQAKTQHKNVIIIFHASWCGWCHKMDTALADPAISPFFEANYVICHLDVQEQDAKKYLENDGADKLLAEYKGDKQGIPFFLFFSKDGNLLADSKMRKPGAGPNDADNTGCPAQKDEVEYFISILKKTSGLKAEQLALIYTRFRENDPKYAQQDVYNPAASPVR
jgi:thioredoxin-related protein